MGLERALRLESEAVIDELRTAGLRERGGSGRSVAERWRLCLDAKGEDKYAVCNALDGDSRAPIARFVLAHDLDAVLEGLLMAAHATGASRCFVCVNADYGEEIVALEEAVERLRQRRAPAMGAPAAGRSESEPPVDICILALPASLVAAQETAVIRALEDRQPLPYLRADDVSGVHGAPTLVENAETLAAVSAIFREGAAGAPPDGAPATTKVVTVTGDVAHQRTLHVPLGTSIAAVIEQVEGRPLSELDVKAVQFGGPTGRFFAGVALDTKIAYEDLERAGAVIGSAAIEVFSSGRCAVEMARDATARLREESCGKCVFCREGTRQLLDILNDISECRASEEQVELLRELGEAMKTGGICAVGQGAALPALSALELFGEDFKSHLEQKRCPGQTT